MKAKCIKPLCVDGYQFEEGKEYDIEWKEFVRERDDLDPVLARGHRVRHIQYAVNYDFLLPKVCRMGMEKVPATLYLYDRPYCEHKDYTAPVIDPLGLTSGGPLLCFDDFFKEVHDVSGRMWSPKPDPSLLKPAKMSPFVKQKMEKTIESILGDKKDQPLILPSSLPKRMDYERWKQQMLGYPRQPMDEQLTAIIIKGKLVFGGITPDELMELYKKWDYKYKPEYLYFSRTFDELIKRGFDFQEYLEEMRIQAYYSHHHPETDAGFDQLACLIYLAMAKGMKTPYDHILNSDKDFEYKLNHLHKEE